MAIEGIFTDSIVMGKKMQVIVDLRQLGTLYRMLFTVVGLVCRGSPKGSITTSI